MAEALAQTIGYVNRARAFMPPGTVGPFIMRFDAGTVPVGYLVFKSDTRSLGEIQDLALNRVRPQFATLPGLTSPPPFGGSQRTIVIRVDPDRLRSYGMAPDDVIRAVTTGNVIMPSGSVNIGDETRISPMNSVVGAINDLLDLPIRTGAGTPISIRDVGSVADSTDIPTAYALVDGRRAVYIPVTKRPDASTLSVVSAVRANLARFQALVPDDITVTYELDQSRSVSAALLAVFNEAVLGALLTGLMVLLFLRDWRSSAIVVVTIPFALLAAVVALWGAGQTINIMTMGGLALAVGILVDEATVAIENIHTHLARGTPVARAVLDASAEVVVPRLLAMLSVVAVFVPSFFMTGVSRSLFMPLSLAVGFAMIASFLLSSSLVPVLSVWLLRGHHHASAGAGHGADWVDRLRTRLGALLTRVAPARIGVVAVYLLVAVGLVAAIGPLPLAAGGARARGLHRRDANRHADPVRRRRLSRPGVVGHDCAHRAVGGRRHPHDGGRTRRAEWRRTAHARHILSGALAGPAHGPLAVRAEWQRGRHDRPELRHPRARRQDGMGGREDRPHLGHAGRGLRRPEGRG